MLLLIKKTQKNNGLLILRLWYSNISLVDVDLPLWIGSVKYYIPESNGFSLHRFKHEPVFIGATGIFTRYLKDFPWRQKVYAPEQQPEEMQKLHWDGKLLIIRPK